MDGYAVCKKCGLKTVRHVERRGILLRFCEVCDWGEVGTDEHPPGRELEEKQGVVTP